MKILIVGGHSALAHMLRPALASLGEVLTAGRSGCDVTLDLSASSERFCLPQDIDVVVNTAAHFGGADFNALLEAEHINALGGLKLCHAASESGIRHFVNISSINAYLESDSAYYGAYSLSKRHADELIQLYCARAGLPCAILRPSQLYGEPDSFRRNQPFLYGTLDKALRNEDIVIYGNRDAQRNYLHAQDLCRIISCVISSRVEGLFACTTPQDSSLLAVSNTIVKAAGSASKVIFNRAMNDIADNVFPYDDTLYRRIGTYPEIDLNDGIGRLVTKRLMTS